MDVFFVFLVLIVKCLERRRRRQVQQSLSSPRPPLLFAWRVPPQPFVFLLVLLRPFAVRGLRFRRAALPGRHMEDDGDSGYCWRRRRRTNDIVRVSRRRGRGGWTCWRCWCQLHVLPEPRPQPLQAPDDDQRATGLRELLLPVLVGLADAQGRRADGQEGLHRRPHHASASARGIDDDDDDSRGERVGRVVLRGALIELQLRTTIDQFDELLLLPGLMRLWAAAS